MCHFFWGGGVKQPQICCLLFIQPLRVYRQHVLNYSIFCFLTGQALRTISFHHLRFLSDVPEFTAAVKAPLENPF